MLPVYAIVAMDEERAIGRNGSLPWHLPQDLKHFSQLTKGHTVLMGRKTYESLPAKFRPLPQRLNIVLSRSIQSSENQDTVYITKLDQLSSLENLRGEIIWAIGGAEIYKLTQPFWSKIFLTRVAGKHGGDVFFPPFENDFKLIDSKIDVSMGLKCIFEAYERKS